MKKFIMTKIVTLSILGITFLTIFALCSIYNNENGVFNDNFHSKDIYDEMSIECSGTEKGLDEGIGTYFEVTDSSYLNVTLSSTEIVKIYLESVPKMVSFIIERNNSATATFLTLSGFEPNTEYYHYEDGYLIQNFISTSAGEYSYSQNILQSHHIFIVEQQSTIYIYSSGDVSRPDLISRSGNLYSFLTDISQPIVIQRDGITLDGNGYTLNGFGQYEYGVYLNHMNGVTVTNIHAIGFGIWGILLDYSSNNYIINNVLEANNGEGIRLLSSTNNLISNNLVLDNYQMGIFILYGSNFNTISGNTIIGGSWAIEIYQSYNNDLIDNTLQNTGSGFFLRDSANNKVYHNNIIGGYTQGEDNNIPNNDWYDTVNLEGNYWSKYIGVDDGSGTEKHSVAGDGIGDTFVPYLGLDEYPFVNENGWLSNTPPLAVDDTATTDEDTTVVIDVLGNDSDVDGDILYIDSVGFPSHGSASINQDNTITYIPDANYYGQDSFTYTMADGKGGSDTATVSINVNSVNDDPVAVDDTALTLEDTPITIDVLANDLDIDGDYLMIVSVVLPLHGTAIIFEEKIIYTPNLDYFGSDSFSYTMGDGNGGFDTATITITVEHFHIIIDDTDPTRNWTYTASHYSWCSGSGLQSDPYIIEDLVIDGRNIFTCIEIRYSGVYFEIRNCHLINAGDAGIKLSSCTYGTLHNNIITNSKIGIILYGSDHNLIENNILNYNEEDGIYLTSSFLNEIRDNTINYNQQFGIHMDTAHNTNIIGNLISYNLGYGGIHMEFTAAVNIRLNTIEYNYLGVEFYYSFNFVNIEENIISNNEQEGILCSSSDSINVINNIISSNGRFAITCYECVSIEISQNTLENNYGGITCVDSSFFAIYGNNIINSNYVGISINRDCTSIIITENVIQGSEFTGVVLDLDSENNEVYNNQFISNINQAMDDGINNKWDNGIIGNYWDDYSGIDYDDDGIGDSPYLISGSAENQDNLPIWDDGYTPVAVDDSATTMEDQSIFIDVLSNDYDLDGDLLVIVDLTDPLGGVVIDNGDGIVYFLPDPDFNGVTSFNYRVFDGTANSNFATVVITIIAVNDAPVANVIGPNVVDEGMLIVFDASGSTDVEGDQLQFRWDFDSDGIWDTSWSNDPLASHIYADNGIYNVILAVMDNEGGVGTDSLIVTVNNVAPSILSVSNRVIDEDTIYIYSWGFTDPGILDWHNYSIDWGDSIIDTGIIVEGVYSLSVDHVYADPGTYIITITISDKDGGQNTISSEVEVLDITPPTTEINLIGIDDIEGNFITDVEVELSATDTHSGIAFTYYRIDNGNWLIYSGSITIFGPESHTIDFYSVDTLGYAEVIQTKNISIGGTIFIRSDGIIDPFDAPISVDNGEYVFLESVYANLYIEKDSCIVDGNGFTLCRETTYGIYAQGIRSTIIQNFILEGFEYGLMLNSSRDMIIYNNHINGGPNVKGGMVLDEFSRTNLIYGNEFTNINGEAMIFREYSGDNTISQNIISNCQLGIEVIQSESNLFSGNNFFNIEAAALLIRSTRRMYISGNNFIDCETGIVLTDSSETEIRMNEFSDCLMFAIICIASEENIISENLLIHNYIAISLLDNSMNNLVYENRIERNERGMELIDSSSNNLIYHNSFIKNLEDVLEYSSINNWYNDQLLEGNYWDTYTGVDDGSGDGKHAIAGDFIGDTNLPFLQDLYPIVLTTISYTGTEGNFGWFKSEVTATILVNNFIPIQITKYNINNEGWNDYDGSFDIIEEGIYTIQFQSFDTTGASESIKTSVLMIDMTAPTSEAVPNQDIWYVNDVEISLNAVDILSGLAYINYSLDGLVWNEYINPIIISNEGITTIYFYSVDIAGNRELQNSIDIKIDKTLPESTHFLEGILGENEWYVSNVNISLSSWDAFSGVLYTEYRINEEDWITYSDKFEIDMEGITDLYYRSVDNAGNVEVEIHVIIKIDKSTPETELIITDGFTDEEGNIYVTYNSTFIIVGLDEHSGIFNTFYSINSGDWFEFLEPFNLTGDPGEYIISYYSTDFAGNIEAVNSTIVTLKSEFDVICEGFGMLRINGQRFVGVATLSLSEDVIQLEIEDQIATWDVECYYELRNIEIYKGEGELGWIKVIVISCGSSTYVVAIGAGVLFIGYT
ncbi:MAG: NosD domain-containing protein [Promethearchaeota archaeon]